MIWLSNKIYNACWKAKRFVRKQYYNTRNIMRLNSTGVLYEKDIETNGKLIISNCGKMQLGKGIVINSGNYPNPVGCSDSRLYTEKADSYLEIGDNTGMSNVMIYASSQIYIGKNVLIGAETTIFDTDFHTFEYVRNNKDEGEPLIASPITIGDDVFIGTRCIILKGVTIGKGSVIGAGSVVTGNIPEYEVWAGNPARFIRKLRNKNND